MATITTQTIKVDLTPGRVYPVLHVSQGDVGLEALEFYIYQNGQPYPIPSEVTAINIDGMTPVGVFSYACTWSGNVVTAGLTATMTAERGIDICELALYDSTNNKIGTCNFVIAVEESPFTNAHVSDSDMATIMAAATEVQQNTLLSKSWAVGDTGIRSGEDTNNSNYWADMSESWAVGGTGKRTGENTNNSEYWSTVSHEYANTVSYKKVFPNVAAMIADIALIDGQVCRTLGESVANDGKAAIYRMSTTVPLAEHVTLDNGLYAEKIYQFEDESFIAERVFRHIYYFDENGYTTYSAQGITNTGTTIITGGRVAADNSAQRIAEFQMDGTLIRVVTLTSSDLFHGNGLGYNAEDGMLYACGDGGKICVIDYTDFTIQRVLSTGLTSVLGVDCDAGKVYVYGYRVSGTYIIGTINTSSGAFTEICSFSVSNASIVLQDMAVKNGFAYICGNLNNKFIKLNLVSGDIDNVIELQAGDGMYPYGELESATFVGNQLYFISSVWYEGYQGVNGTYMQVFKSNIGGKAFKRSLFGQGIGSPTAYTRYVDASNTSLNPTGESDNAFESLPEIAAFFMYHNDSSGKQYRIIVAENQDLTGQVLLLSGVSAYIRLNHCSSGDLVLKNGNYYIRSANCNIYANAADVYIIQSTVNTYYHTFGNVVFGPSNTIQSYHFEMCSIVPNNGDDLKNISANAGLSNIYGTICLELKPGNITVTGSGWEDDVIGLPTPNTHRMAYLFYNGADGLLGTIWKRSDGKIKSSEAFTLVASNTLYLSGIATA